jgi:TolB-like protein
MELVDGTSLVEAIPAGGLPLGRLFEIAVPLAEALAAAHDKGIVHRDLKPANVMLDAQGHLKVLDFGLAKAATSGTATGATATDFATAAGTVFGTVPYMSPEQVSARATDARTDVFAFGVILYEMATGTRPFRGDSSPELMSAILRDVPALVTDRRRDLPAHLARIVRRCLEKSPMDRYQTMREVRRDLHDLKKETESDVSRRSGSGPAQTLREAFWITLRPLKVFQGDLELQSFADGLAEDITTGLSRFPYLSVAARDAAQQTRYLLEGSLRRSASTIRISVQLIDAQHGTQMWAETYNRDSAAADIFTVQDDVTDRVVATVADVYGVLVRSMMQSIRQVPIDQLSASELVVRYWNYHHNPKREEHGRLREALETSAAREPNNAEVWAALAYLYVHEYSHWFNTRPDPLLRAWRAAQKAIDLEPASQHGWEALAVVNFFTKDRHAFSAAAERAMSLNARNTNTAAFMALLFAHTGETERAFAIVQRARALNSHHPGWYYCVDFDLHYLAGRYEDAYAAIKRVNMPELVFPQLLLAEVCGQLGRAEEARSALQAVWAIEPALQQSEVVDELGLRWFWDEAIQAPYREGHRKALAFV